MSTKKRNTLVKVKLREDWKGVPKGTISKARTMGFACILLDAPYAGIEVGKSKYRVLEVLADE